MIDLKKLAELPHGQAEKVLKESGNWKKNEYTFRITGRYFRITGRYDPEPETMTVKVMAIDLESAETAAEGQCDFDKIEEIELMTAGVEGD